MADSIRLHVVLFPRFPQCWDTTLAADCGYERHLSRKEKKTRRSKYMPLKSYFLGFLCVTTQVTFVIAMFKNVNILLFTLQI